MEVIYKKIIYKLNQFYNAYIRKNESAILALRWLKEDKKKDFRYNYNIFENAIIFDCGGFKGNWVEKILKRKPNAQVWVFELVPEYIEILKFKFKKNSNVLIHDFGLGNENKKIVLFENDVASSVFISEEGRTRVKGSIVDVVEFVSSKNLVSIDLIKMNIEGGEYELLERILEGGIVERFKNFQIQFHNYGENFEKRREKIRTELTKTHHLTYDFPWIFENWEINN